MVPGIDVVLLFQIYLQTLATVPSRLNTADGARIAAKRAMLAIQMNISTKAEMLVAEIEAALEKYRQASDRVKLIPADIPAGLVELDSSPDTEKAMNGKPTNEKATAIDDLSRALDQLYGITLHTNGSYVQRAYCSSIQTHSADEHK